MALRARPDVDTKRVFLIGGSIGGAFAVALEYDWVMGAQEPGFAAARVNRFHPDRAISRVYVGLSHGIHTYGNAADAFHGQNGKYDPAIAADVSRWLRRIAGSDNRAK